MNLLINKTALITGGSDGIGFATAIAFAEQGANLILIGRDKEKLGCREKLLKQYDITVLSIPADISNKDSFSEIVEQVRTKNIKIDIIVNNAGIARFIPFVNTDIPTLDYHLNLNVKAPYLLTQAFLDDLIESRGNVINISSYFSRRMLPDRPSTAYSMTKGAIESFTKALAFELGPHGVRVNAIAPGTVATPQVESNLECLDRKAKDRFNSMIKSIYPLQTIGEPKDIANMAVFLASDQAKWVTGGIFPVDGGLTIN
ncbi:SDR family oxidoreductase [Pelosinus sp. IPA-1]|uniref:SDR family NAD(P)-dependent oxidoreductase n=1 Tax=Pelosinus sp. IPA-1 TaxID=3029569 RepID=UPI00243625EE|nr:SDR family oxidoreductase [Pelosinus sp. IPA-1]GMA98171.1 dehydrogenase [Pelosinus sp. IPA-1]